MRIAGHGVAVAALLAASARAQVVLNEISAASSDRALQWSADGVPKLGTGTAWHERDFDDTGWASGPGPFGYGVGTALGTNLQAAMRLRTPSVYLRRTFAVTPEQAASTSSLLLSVDYDSGFVAYINGREVGRRNLGATNSPSWHDQHAHNQRVSGVTETLVASAASVLLVPGENTLAILAVNNNNTPSTINLNWVTDPVNADAAFLLKADLRINTTPLQTLVASTDTWRFFPGYVEPSGTFFDPGLMAPSAPAGGEDGDAEGPRAETDWVELRNLGASPVDLSGWSLTDRANDRNLWRFPSGSIIPAGGYLVVACDGLNLAPGTRGAAYHHAGFELSRDGEYLGLVRPDGTVADQIAPGFPPQTPFHSWGRNAAGQWAYLDDPSPGRANRGAEFSGIVSAPAVNIAGGFHPAPLTVTATTGTPGALIRYTTDGSEPSAASAIVAGPLSVTGSLSLRLRAFAPGMIPSDVATHTYLINQSAARRGVPAFCITADQTRALYRPHGMMAVVGGSFGVVTAGVWGAGGNHQAYNNCIPRGRFTERPAALEILADGAPALLRTDIGLRLSGSTYQRPRYTLTNQNSATPNSASPWTWNSNVQKPSFNLYFRSEYGDPRVTGAVFPQSSVESHDSFRLRSGKNDNTNPWIRDEWFRRTLREMGHISATGTIGTLYVNGVFKGFYNPTERLREDFFKTALRTENGIDIRQMAGAGNGLPVEIDGGDTVQYDEMIAWIKSADFNSPTAWQGLTARMDMVNACDYLLLNIFGAPSDWGVNNLVNYRERAPWGRQRFALWDAESALTTSRDKTNQITDRLLNATHYSQGSPVAILYTEVKDNPEFKLLMADRIHRHMFNGGALTETRMLGSWQALADVFQPLLREVSGNAASSVTPLLPDWVNGKGDTSRYTTSGATNRPTRRRVLLDGFIDDTAGGAAVTGHLRAAGLWPLTQPPRFGQHGGTVPAGYSLTITNPGNAGTIIHTIDGRDPRAAGGTVVGTTYGAPLAIARPTLVKARVFNPSAPDGLAWSALTEAVFTPPSGAATLAITEIHYHPTATPPQTEEDFEFIELMNTGAAPVELGGFTFTAGIDFTFPGGVSLQPGARLVLVHNATAFAQRHPGVPIAGEFPSSSLSNDGERLELRDVSGNVVAAAEYGADGSWPETADGAGFSLVRIDPNSSVDDPAGWRASTLAGGSPGVEDPPVTAAPILVSEALANSGPMAEDFIELHNPGAAAVDVSGWYLTDDPQMPAKYRIPAGTMIAAGGYAVVNGSQFNAQPGQPGSFALGSDGDDAWIFSADAAGTLTGWSHGFSFGAQDEGVSFGRHVNSAGIERFVPQQAATPGAANAGPLVGPVVITEIMYHPADGGVEFIELRNRSAQPQPLFTAGTPQVWQVSGIAWQFPPGRTLLPGQYAILCGGDPDVFRAAHQVPDAVPVIGPFSGSLSNAGEWLALQRPGAPVTDPVTGATLVPEIDMDRVFYDDAAPWPVSADGTGPSLERLADSLFADDPAHWRASPAAGGSPGRGPVLTFSEWRQARLSRLPTALAEAGADADGDGLPNLMEFATGSDPLASSLSPLLVVQESGILTLRWSRSPSASGVALVLERSNDLTQWTPAEGTSAVVPAGDGTDTWSLPEVPAGTARHYRLRCLLQ